MPIVHMGSEGQNNFVLASDALGFLRLLAIGYDELGFADLSSPPGDEGVNPAFQEWVSKTFSVSIPKTGDESLTLRKRPMMTFMSGSIRVVGDLSEQFAQLSVWFRL